MKSKSTSPEPKPEQQLVHAMPTTVCDVVNITPVESMCSSVVDPSNAACSLTENETPDEDHFRRPQSVELADRPSSQLSTGSEQNPWQVKKRKKKKRIKNSGSVNLDERRGFRVLSELDTE